MVSVAVPDEAAPAPKPRPATAATQASAVAVTSHATGRLIPSAPAHPLAARADPVVSVAAIEDNPIPSGAALDAVAPARVQVDDVSAATGRDAVPAARSPDPVGVARAVDPLAVDIGAPSPVRAHADGDVVRGDVVRGAGGVENRRGAEVNPQLAIGVRGS